MHPDPIAWIELTDGTWRAVREDFADRQYVLDDDGVPVYGVWFIPPPGCDVPVIVDAHPDGPTPF